MAYIDAGVNIDLERSLVPTLVRILYDRFILLYANEMNIAKYDVGWKHVGVAAIVFKEWYLFYCHNTLENKKARDRNLDASSLSGIGVGALKN